MGSRATQEQAKFWRADDLGGLELLRATYITHEFARHSHPEFMVGVIEQGTCTFYYRGDIHVAPAGSIVLINPGEAHDGSGGEARSLTYRTFYPAEGLLQQIASEVAGRQWGIPYFSVPVLQNQPLSLLLRRLHGVLEQSTSTLERESVFLWTFAQLISRHAERRPTSPAPGSEHLAIRQACDFLVAHHTTNVSLAALAALAQLSPYHFLRVFRACLGLPPHAYLVQLRVAAAKRLLAQGMPIPQAAVEAGFVDQSHLTRHFKRLVGVTPGQYVLGNKREQEHTRHRYLLPLD
ncbi:MAG TPA: AraC family transcriptional regulator [Ktedonobacterales bacterium]|jgi:AraC-like DNA-binding protein